MSAEPGLLGRTVVIVGAGTGAGRETARQAKAAGARLILTDRRPGLLEDVADDIGAEATAAFDESDPVRLRLFLDDLPGVVDHLLLNGDPPLGRQVRCVVGYARRAMPDGGSLVFVAGGRGPDARSLARAAAPVRVNVIIAGWDPGATAAAGVRLMCDVTRNATLTDLSRGTRPAGTGVS